jgi:hypothetical protein
MRLFSNLSSYTSNDFEVVSRMPFHIANAIWTDYCERVEEDNEKEEERRKSGGFGGGFSVPSMPSLPNMPKMPSMPSFPR